MPGKKKRLEDAIAFLDSGRADGCGVCLEIPRFGSWSWSESKKLLAAFAVKSIGPFAIARDDPYEIFLAGTRACISMLATCRSSFRPRRLPISASAVRSGRDTAVGNQGASVHSSILAIRDDWRAIQVG